MEATSPAPNPAEAATGASISEPAERAAQPVAAGAAVGPEQPVLPAPTVSKVGDEPESPPVVAPPTPAVPKVPSGARNESGPKPEPAQESRPAAPAQPAAPDRFAATAYMPLRRSLRPRRAKAAPAAPVAKPPTPAPSSPSPRRAREAQRAAPSRKRKSHHGKRLPPVRKQRFVGLKNQGATCYINCIVQSMFHLPRFRELVDTVDADPQQHPVTHALQRVFRGLLVSRLAVSTRSLTAALKLDANLQQDVHEYLCLVLTRMETELKGTPAADTVTKMFNGMVENRLEYVGINKEGSAKQQVCPQLSLRVKGCQGLKDALEQYASPERIQHRVDGHKDMVQVDKRTVFVSFPPVLPLSLNRFEYDKSKQKACKIHQRFSFPTSIDLDRLTSESAEPPPDGVAGPSAATRASSRDDTDVGPHVLHSIFVHAGSAESGHYKVYIRPDARLSQEEDNEDAKAGSGPGELRDDGTWYCFDDDNVSKVSYDEAVLKAFGKGKIEKQADASDDPAAAAAQGGGSRNNNRGKTAYMLIYARASEAAYTPTFSEETRRKIERMEMARERHAAAAVQAQKKAAIAASLKRMACDGCGKNLSKRGIRKDGSIAYRACRTEGCSGSGSSASMRKKRRRIREGKTAANSDISDSDSPAPNARLSLTEIRDAVNKALKDSGGSYSLVQRLAKILAEESKRIEAEKHAETNATVKSSVAPVTMGEERGGGYSRSLRRRKSRDQIAAEEDRMRKYKEQCKQLTTPQPNRLFCADRLMSTWSRKPQTPIAEHRRFLLSSWMGQSDSVKHKYKVMCARFRDLDSQGKGRVREAMDEHKRFVSEVPDAFDERCRERVRSKARKRTTTRKRKARSPRGPKSPRKNRRKVDVAQDQTENGDALASAVQARRSRQERARDRAMRKSAAMAQAFIVETVGAARKTTASKETIVEKAADAASSAKPGRLTCPCCGHAFSTERTLRRHLLGDTPKCRRESPPMDDAKRAELLKDAYELVKPYRRGSRAKKQVAKSPPAVRAPSKPTPVAAPETAPVVVPDVAPVVVPEMASQTTPKNVIMDVVNTTPENAPSTRPEMPKAPPKAVPEPVALATAPVLASEDEKQRSGSVQTPCAVVAPDLSAQLATDPQLLQDAVFVEATLVEPSLGPQGFASGDVACIALAKPVVLPKSSATPEPASILQV